MKKNNAINIISAVLLIVLVFFDLFSKQMAVEYLQNKNSVVLIPGFIELHYLEGGNTGAAWGLFSGKISFLLFFTIIITLAIIYIFFRINKKIKVFSGELSTLTIRKYRILQLCIVLLVAGSIGNIINRLFLGYVIDFLNFLFINFPIFNIADCYVVIGAVIVVIMISFIIKDDELSYLEIFSKNKKVE